jgi:hypothetical protein
MLFAAGKNNRDRQHVVRGKTHVVCHKSQIILAENMSFAGFNQELRLFLRKNRASWVNGK